MENITLEDLEKLQEELFKQECDLDIKKAMVKHFIKKKKEAINFTGSSLQLKEKKEKIIESIKYLENGERVDVFSSFCVMCGGDDPKCNCMRDD